MDKQPLDEWKPMSALLDMEAFDVWLPLRGVIRGGVSVPARRDLKSGLITFLGAGNRYHSVKPTHFRARSKGPQS